MSSMLRGSSDSGESGIQAGPDCGESPGELPSLAPDFRELQDLEQRRVLFDLVHAHVAAALRSESPRTLDAESSFLDLGLDSLAAVNLHHGLVAATGLTLDVSLAYDYPTPSELVEDRLHRKIFPVAGDDTAPARAVVGSDDPIAIVGMSCRFPGGVNSPEDLWKVVSEGVDAAVTPFPTDRGWDLEALYSPDPDQPGTSYATEGGFIHDAPEFDAEFFGISPREALAMDPQQRLLLETSWEVFERAGIDVTKLRGSRTAVFTGAEHHDYGPHLQSTKSGLEGYALTGIAGSVASGRIAYTFGFEGPAWTVDTACSSSLVSLHQAAHSLRQGECDLALATGVATMPAQGDFSLFSRQRGLSSNGRCQGVRRRGRRHVVGRGRRRPPGGAAFGRPAQRPRGAGHRAWHRRQPGRRLQRSDRPQRASRAEAVATLYTNGVGVDWNAVYAGRGARRVGLPTYAFQHKRYWLEAGGAVTGDARSVGLGRVDHPLLGGLTELADGERTVLTGRLSLETDPWLADRCRGRRECSSPVPDSWNWACRGHRDRGRSARRAHPRDAAAPSSRAASASSSWSAPRTSPGTGRSACTRAPTADASSRARSGCDAPRASSRRTAAPRSPTACCSRPSQGAEQVPMEGFYEGLAEVGYGYGPVFQGLEWVPGGWTAMSSPRWHCRTRRPRTPDASACTPPCSTPPCTPWRWATSAARAGG
ncbi:hypothetical protein SANTM175S_03558 [Streptomyces antimycoticus]